MSHTPGPWRYARSGYGSRAADFDIVGDQGGRVASTPYEDKARLIAAAPDLLAALHQCVFAIHIAQQQELRRGDKSASAWDHILKPAEAAIARAEGK